MRAGLWPAAIFCMASGVALGCLFLLCKGLRLTLGLGKWATGILDILFCCICAVWVFLCALGVDMGRLRFFQVFFQGVGAWSVVMVFDPFISKMAGFFRKIGKSIGRAVRPFLEKIGRRFVRKQRKKAKNRKKTGQKAKKAQKKT